MPRSQERALEVIDAVLKEEEKTCGQRRRNFSPRRSKREACDDEDHSRRYGRGQRSSGDC